MNLDLKPAQHAALAPLVAAYPRGVPVDSRDLNLIRAYAGLEIMGLATIKQADTQVAFATLQGRAFQHRTAT